MVVHMLPAVGDQDSELQRLVTGFGWPYQSPWRKTSETLQCALIWGCGEPRGCIMWGANRRGPGQTEVVSRSTHDEPPFVEQKAHTVYDHLYRKSFFAVHKIAD